MDNMTCLEALLFASGKPVESKMLCEVMEISQEQLKEAVDALSKKLNSDDSGIQLIEINDGYQLGTKEEPLVYIKGNPPSFAGEIIGDAFAIRNDYAMKIDYVMDIFTPHYGTDCETFLYAVHDVRFSAIGFCTMY